MPIDMHSHYYGGYEDLRKRTHRPYVAADKLGRDVLHAMTASTVMSEGYTDLRARLTYLNSTGIQTQLMTFRARSAWMPRMRIRLLRRCTSQRSPR